MIQSRNYHCIICAKVSFIVLLRLPHLLGCIVSAALCLVAFKTSAQVRATPHASSSSPKPSDAPPTPIPTSLSLNLCVDNSTTYPCPVPIISDGLYVPAITLTYGQVLDGVVVYSPVLTDGTISIYRTGQDAPVCVLRIAIDTSCPPSSTIFDFGTYTLTATLTFPSGSAYAPSDALPVIVSVEKDSSSITLKSSSTPSSPVGSPVTFTATATGGFNAIPTGQIDFTIDGTPVPSPAINATGSVSLTTSALALGVHHIHASYQGSLDFLPASPDVDLDQTIVPDSTSTTLTSNINPSFSGQNVIFTAKVAAPSVPPTGAVTFADGANPPFATAAVTPQGVAQASIATLTVGTHNIVASYGGDSSNLPSTSAPLVQKVEIPPNSSYTLTITPSPVTVGIGDTAHLTVTVAELGGFFGPVTLSCSDLPNESTCTFGEAVIPAGGGTTTLDLTAMAPHDCGSAAPYFHASTRLASPGNPLRYTLPVLAGIFLFTLPKRRSIRTTIPKLLALSAIFVLASLTACSSHCTDFGTYPGHYTFKVNGSAPAAPGSPTIDVTTAVALSVKL